MSELGACPSSFSTFLQGGASAAEQRIVLRHLLRGCEVCRAAAGTLWSPRHSSHSSTSTQAHADSFSRVVANLDSWEEALRKERVEAPRLLVELLPHPPARQLMMISNSRRFQTWGFCELLVKESHELRLDDPHRAVQLGELAVAVADALEPSHYRATLTADLRARAWAFLADAKRNASDLAGADTAFGHAEALLLQGTGDPLEHAQFLQLKSKLRYFQRRFEEALELLDQALATYRRLGERHLAGQTLILKGSYLGEAQAFEDSISLLQEGLHLIDAERDPRFVLMAKHNLVLYLQASGHLEEALDRLEELRPHYAELGDSTSMLRLRWLEGKLLAEQNQYEDAQQAFREVRDAFLEQGLTYDVAAVSMDLASAFLNQGRIEEVKVLSSELITLFASLEIPRETYAALLLFSNAARLERVTLKLVQDLSAYLHEARKSPGTAFTGSP